MLLKDLYQLAIDMGIAADIRGEAAVNKLLSETKDKFEKLDDDKKREFDQEKLTNPYSDTRISYGDLETEVKCLITGIDVETSELLLVRELNKQGREIDLVLSHHPVGMGSVYFQEVMAVQADMMVEMGIPINVAEAILDPRIKEVERRLLPANHYRIVDAARLLDMPLMCIHTPSDNNACKIVQDHLDREKPEKLKDILTSLRNITEYKRAAKMGNGPCILVGKEDNRCGKIVVSMTGGTSGPKEDVKAMVDAGVGTIVEMHISDEKKNLAEEHHLNVIIAGHMASDSVGMNAILDEIERKGVKVIPFSGLIRVKRS